MSTRILTYGIVIVFVSFAVFGLYVPMAGHADHGSGCMFSFGFATICGLSLAHLDHWKAALMATFTSLLLLWVALLAPLSARPAPHDVHHLRYRTRRCAPQKPTLFQELFAAGILNPKAP